MVIEKEISLKSAVADKNDVTDEATFFLSSTFHQVPRTSKHFVIRRSSNFIPLIWEIVIVISLIKKDIVCESL